MKTFFTSVMIAMVLVPNLYATSFGSNIVTNGDAEAGDTSGWTATLNPSAFTNCYSYLGENVQEYHGKVFEIYDGGANVAAKFSQTINISDFQSQVATGLVSLTFSVQAFSWYGATALYTVEELGTSDNVLNAHTDGISLSPQNVNYISYGGNHFDTTACAWTTTPLEVARLHVSTTQLRISIYGKTSNIASDYVDFDNIQLILSTAPTVTTAPVSTYDKNSVTLGGNVTADNGATVTARGVVYSSTDATPTIGEAGVTKDVNGSGAGSFSESIGSLSAGTTYYIRAYATNTSGTSYGSVVSFTTTAPPSISNVSAPDNGTYILGQNLDYTVNFNEAVNVVTTGGTPYLTLTVGSSTVHAAYYTGTTTSTLTFRYTVASGDYDVDGIALSSNITLNGGSIKDAANNDATLSFTGSTATNVQIGISPTVATKSASSVSSTSATLKGFVNPNNATSVVTFDYGTSSSYGSTVTATQSPVTGTSATSVSAALTGLTPNTTYHFRVKAVNTAGTTYGADSIFTTSAIAPTAATKSASSVSSTSATLNGVVNPNNATSVVMFDYGTSSSYGSTVTATQSPVTGTSATSVSAALTGLTPNTTYHFRVKAVNTAGTTYGADSTFTTSAIAPTVTTDAANSLTSSGATMNGTVNANNTETSVTFEYGLTTAYGSTITALESPVNGTSAVAVSYVLEGLAANTTYHYRVVATNSGGTTYGDDMTFATSEVTGMDYAANEPLVLYPNPTQDGFYVNSGETACELTVYTLSGQVVYHQSVRKGSFVAMASFASGVYLVKVNDKIQKLIKN